jgi:hypothetical protein
MISTATQSANLFALLQAYNYSVISTLDPKDPQLNAFHILMQIFEE